MKKILLHVCCGPCAIAPVLRLREQGFDVSALFVNPNIHPLSEYLRRRESMQECAHKLNLPVLWRDDIWDIQKWTHIVSHAQALGETRCAYCYSSRFEICAEMTKTNNFDAFCSSLLYSRYQNHELIKTKAADAAQKYNVNFYYDDFRDDWHKGIEISKEFNLYRQNYCGCIYSEYDRYAKKLTNLQKQSEKHF